MLQVRSLVLFLSLFGLFAVACFATTVDFDTFTPADTCLSSLSTGGLTFTNSGTGCLAVWTGSPNTPGIGDLIFGFGGTVAITQTDNSAFDLNSLDMTISWYDSLASDTASLTADFQGGGSSTTTLTLGQGLALYNLGLSDVTEVDLSGLASDTGYWAIDQIDYTSVVPEPSATPLVIGLAVAMFVAFRRKVKIA